MPSRLSSAVSSAHAVRRDEIFQPIRIQGDRRTGTGIHSRKDLILHSRSIV